MARTRCNDQVVGAILASWRYDISGITPEMRRDYERHFADCGEVMARYGGCGIIPSGTYHAEVPSTVLNAANRVDGHALELLPEMAERFGGSRSAGR